MEKLTPDNAAATKEKYRGPVSLLKEAYETTAALGSTTILLGILDNSTRIHGKLHPMVAVLTIGGCELLMLRRMQGRQSPYQAVFHTEMQRIDGHMQTPLQLARVDDRVDPDFDEDIALEVIERGSAGHCLLQGKANSSQRIPDFWAKSHRLLLKLAITRRGQGPWGICLRHP